MSLAAESTAARSTFALTACVKAIVDLSPCERDDMFALMTEHYLHVGRDTFDADLAEKQWAILVCDKSGGIRGFSTQRILSLQLGGQTIHALFSGDTIVHRDAWGQQALARAWGRFALRLMDDYAGDELYWFLISKGYKTYRFLPVFFKEYYPCINTKAPANIASRMRAFAVAKFGAAFDQKRGVITATENSCRLRPGLAELTDERLRDEHIRFFHTANPRAADGEELCCIAPLTRENFTDAAYRVINLDGG